MKILISRIDSIGDVILTLPLCGWIKYNIPKAKVIFLCQELTFDIVKKSSFVDEIVEWNNYLPNVDVIIHVFPEKNIAKKAKKAKIRIRIGTSHRTFHWLTCNKLVHFSRIKSDLHESQLNFKLLKGLGLSPLPSLNHMADLIGWISKKSQSTNYIISQKFNLIFHIKSRGSAKEWASANYLNIAQSLPKDSFNIILTGTKLERDLIKKEIPEIFNLENVTDTTGNLSLSELIALIENSDGLLACSTGPLHIASASGINCLGLYPKTKPMHAGRWGPIGLKSQFIEENTESDNKYLAIGTNEVLQKILSWLV